MYELISKVGKASPLVVHYTNEVTINDCANMTLAIGASPLMSYSYEELEDVINIASTVVINIGTMNSSHLDLFVKAAKYANKVGKKLVLDPVGVFASKKRQEIIKILLGEVKFDVIKGNMAEIKFIGGQAVNGQGVDSHEECDDIDQLKAISKTLKTTLAITGKTDVIVDFDNVVKIHNGSPKLKSVTGTGCMINSLIGSFLGVSDNSMDAAVMGILCMSLSGELADKDDLGIGSFKVNLFDNIYKLTEEKIRDLGKVETI
ncbi:hydroxyethylthiazole kinase [Tepidibacter hydrothermalis]|uniref:Hydroxyethylthiazole kinase n=1 Tax=Tepidibacter hydrothermalis TaxID=3036126 RepID=A0ABY8E9K7_9FIRM|nr:hydroxyethylthiazole kinase [Tepidibacter hydrothermalis]WFD09590.1 hydroxyethylthiazole kinase [Tepidibacter hydrothermalis]